MKNNKHVHCPGYDPTCPYWNHGICSMYPADNPAAECDMFIIDEDTKPSDYICTCDEVSQ